MEFVHENSDAKAPVEALHINWIFRPRDIVKKVVDKRLVYASMQSEISPITSLRGKCCIKHLSEISDLEQYRKGKDSFYYTQMYDRYIQRSYDVIPTSKIINVPENVKKVLDDRWKFIIVEAGRGKEMTSAVKSCKRCSGYCANDNSVDCAMCKTTYHMNCVQPPLQKKPARGFAWSCGPCSRKQERRLEARNTPLVGGDGEDEEIFDEDEEIAPTNGNSPSADALEVRAATKEQIAQTIMWPYRYLGIHCKPSDVLDFDDRIYPRASSRLGPRHQVSVPTWPGRPFEYVKAIEIKKKYAKGTSNKKDGKLSDKMPAALEADKHYKERRPKWVVDAPTGYLHRGEDAAREGSPATSKTLFKLPPVGEESSRGGDENDLPDVDEKEKIIDDYMRKAKKIALNLGLPDYHTNFLDKAIELLYIHSFKSDIALQQLQKVDTQKDLKEPKLNKEELKRFEDGVARHGSDLSYVSRYVKTKKHGEIVRFYYVWKKTDKGKAIWSNFPGRKGRKAAKHAEGALLDDVADDLDDSAFDNEKASKKKRGFVCKFCASRDSRFWRRAPTGVTSSIGPSEGTGRGKDKGNSLMIALCNRCAILWRKYALIWEDIEELSKRMTTQIGGRATKRKADEELLRDLVHASELSQTYLSPTTVGAAQSVGLEIPHALTVTPEQEAARKKQKTGPTPEKRVTPPPAIPAEPPPKKKEKPPEPPPLIPEEPKLRKLPCAICQQIDSADDERLSCRHCKLTVHRHCFGIPEGRPIHKWTCETCSNDASNQFSTNYNCILCPMEYNEVELYEQPKASHKKKTDREREKERQEKELFFKAKIEYERMQTEQGRPAVPREALKSTSNNHWMHAVCAIWTPWIKFRDAKLLQQPEGILSIPSNKYNESCKICKLNVGVCTQCPKCPALFHVTCAQQDQYPMGFFVTPVKGSRKDVVGSVSFGNEVGHVEAVIYCPNHDVKSAMHAMNDIVTEDGLTALQCFVRNFKQADSSLTGTVRKAAMINWGQPKEAASGQRASTSNGVNNSGANPLAGSRSSRASPIPVTVKSEEINAEGDRVVHIEAQENVESAPKICTSCRSTISPKWYKQGAKEKTNGNLDYSGPGIGGLANGHTPHYLCHRCEMKNRQTQSPRPPSSAHSPSQSNEANHSTLPVQRTPPWPPATPAYGQPSSQIPPQPVHASSAAIPPALLNGSTHTPPHSHAIPQRPHSPYGASVPPYHANGYPPDRRDPGAPPTMHSGSSYTYAPPNVHTGTIAPHGYGHHRSSEPHSSNVPSQHSHVHHGSHPIYHSTSPQFGTHHLMNGAPPAHVPARVPSPPNSSNYRGSSAGLPRAADNPFASFPGQSPRQQYLGPPLESPRGEMGRPMTPGATAGRDRERERTEGSLMSNGSGASASPSLKNLIH